MACYNPIPAWQHSRNGGPLFFSIPSGYSSQHLGPYRALEIPCGQCVGCRLERSRQWAIRCVHEAQMHKESSFVTLTYSNDNLPSDGSLCPRELTLFLKRLRRSIEPCRIRYFACGEYGELNFRPHYHLIIFGYGFPDKSVWSQRRGNVYYRSKLLEDCWPFGHSTIGGVTFESCAYVARYIMKKVTGDRSEEHYHGRTPEFTRQSRRPGIGLEWLRRFESDVYPGDRVILRGGIVARPPRYYDTKYGEQHEFDLELIKATRRLNSEAHGADGTPDRLFAREQVKLAQIESLHRILDTYDE